MSYKKKSTKPKMVREPVQVYLDVADRAILDHAAAATGLSRAEVLRQGLRRFAAESQSTDDPMLRVAREVAALAWPADTPSDLAARHDAYLADAALDRHDDA